MDGTTRIAVRVTPRAARARLEVGPDGGLHAHVTVPPADGKANAAVLRLLAEHLGVAPSRLRLVRGARSRDKLFALDERGPR